MRARWLLMPLLLALQACSGTTFGERLADSFDSPAAPAAAEETASSKVKQEAKSAVKEQERAEDQPVKNKATAAKTPEAKTSEAKTSEPEDEETDPSEAKTPQEKTNVQPNPIPAEPRPYRITIRLAAADPAAPAESVTDALRRAGISFEVETIEKIPSLQTSKKAASDSPGQL
ncbi:hypothetical protein [Synechococcus sp. ROS8604]|uniref:hypothetical protein n=1 Tax=Synechococcus sp. ROS8604 TaxID=1442557 RepID=UPI00164707BD|nr:hypothetical protein [Synechococcus sp. ROS8604]QNI89445.1 hypothetical protein SynROS8604_02826 [Synechococcus sp. ROS8604]